MSIPVNTRMEFGEFSESSYDNWADRTTVRPGRKRCRWLVGKTVSPTWKNDDNGEQGDKLNPVRKRRKNLKGKTSLSEAGLSNAKKVSKFLSEAGTRQ